MKQDTDTDLSIELPARTQEGAALIIVLAFIVLLAGLVLAFFFRATNERQLSSASATQAKAQLLAQGALDQIIGDLKQEIAAGSTATTVSGVTIYTPSTAATIVPALVGSTGTGGYQNLVKRSTYNSSFYPTANYDNNASNRAAQAPTTAASLNGRFISAPRWNKPLLISKQTPSSDTDLTPAATFTPPDWILVARDGSNPTAWSTNLRSSPTASSSVLGRYAYMIYDEGGLLDMNVAGYPTVTATNPAVMTSTQIGRKGVLSFADLKQIPGISSLSSTGAPSRQDNFIVSVVGWRNYASGNATGNLVTLGSTSYDFATGSNYYNAVTSNSKGFLAVANTSLNNAQSDRMFATRQDLMKLLLQGIASTTGTNSDESNLQNALQYLGTFSRELNRPSWKPYTPTGSAFDYATLAKTPSAENSTAINRDLNSIRDSSGNQLVRTRFPLSRINELLNTTNSSIQADFGLKWNPGQNHWDYVGATGSTVQTAIERLDLVAGENRQPNFFEVLKAVILSRSVGLGSGPGDTFVAHEAKYYDNSSGLSADYQIMQVGANIIDAWDTDNIPTFINFGGKELAGVENLPYLNKLVFCPNVPPQSGPGTADAWLVPSLWNPHQNGSSATSTGNRIRIALTGSPTYKASFTVGSTTYTTNAIVTSPIPTIDVAANGFMAPTPPKTPLATSGAISSVGNPENYYGFHFAFTTPPTTSQVNQKNLDTAYPDFGTTTTGNVELQVQLPDTTYKTYQKWSIFATNHPITAQGVKNNGDWTNTNHLVDPEYVALDPRTLRFGVWGTDASDEGGGAAKKDASYGAQDSLDQAAPANRIELITWSQPQGSSFTVSTLPADLSLYATNGTVSNHYLDLDSVQRRGDWTTDASGTAKGTTILYASAKTPPAGNYLDRPQIPSSPFQSVADLGQVFRDQPWKTLNFTSATTGATGVSADAGLLDAFTLQDVAMTGGKTSLNTRQAAVLTAILSQTIRGIAGTNVISAADISTIANRLVTLTTANPMMNKSELVTRLMADATITGIFNTSTTGNPWNKEAREGVLRAFCDACQTRTWNLMIDVIAQSGRYPPNAGALSDFVVEGEKRYWLHVAIDRFTGQVIDQQLEVVFE
jgi:Tfp pilus assembly protein PilX